MSGRVVEQSSIAMQIRIENPYENSLKRKPLRPAYRIRLYLPSRL